jgi:anti-anti-sigma factor
MEILKKQDNQIITLSLIGRLDTNTAGSLETAINELETNAELILDCEKLEYVSSAGLRVLLLMQKRVNNGIAKFTLINVIEEVKEVLDMTGFSTILNIK